MWCGHYRTSQVRKVVWLLYLKTLSYARSLVTTLRAAEQFDKAHLSSPNVANLIENARYFYIGGFFLTHGVESATELAKAASGAGKVRPASSHLSYFPLK